MVHPEVEVAITARVVQVDDIEQSVTAEFEIFTLCREEEPDSGAIDEFVSVSNYEGFIPDLNLVSVVEDICGGWRISSKVNHFSGESIHIFRNTLCVSQRFNVKLFPYDKQKVNFSIVCSNAVLISWKSNPALVNDRNIEFTENVKKWHEDDVFFVRNMSANWKLKSFKVFERKTDNENKFLNPGKMIMSIVLKRDASFFSINYVFTIALIVAANISLVGIPIDDISGRMGIVVTLLLTLVAVKLILSDLAPRSPTPTYLDLVIFTGFFTMFIIVVEIVVVRLLLEGIVNSGDIDEDELQVEIGDFVFHILVFTNWVIFCSCHSCGGFFCYPVLLCFSKLFSTNKNNLKYIGYHHKEADAGKIHNLSSAFDALKNGEGRRNLMAKGKEKLKEVTTKLSY